MSVQPVQCDLLLTASTVIYDATNPRFNTFTLLDFVNSGKKYSTVREEKIQHVFLCFAVGSQLDLLLYILSYGYPILRFKVKPNLVCFPFLAAPFFALQQHEQRI